jgi:succinoglycan biosynthesis protein ExoM
MSGKGTDISVCVCTYKRPDWLRRLLLELSRQETLGLFTFSIVVADNDGAESARSAVEEFASSSEIPVKYCVQPQQSIALARNSAVKNSAGDYIAFIDDDEFPARLWLATLFQTCEEHAVDGVLGPVKRHFDERPPRWVLKGDFYERPYYPTGTVLHWSKGRTGNLLFRKQMIAGEEEPFRPEFRAGEDQDFFRRMIERGHTFIWCADAVAFEVVPPSRWKIHNMLRRALLRGATAVVHPTFGTRDVLKSMVAVPVYTAALPLALLLGQHRMVKLLVSMFDHLGKLLALVGLNPVKEQYVID